jgi:hypothetical protein
MYSYFFFLKEWVEQKKYIYLSNSCYLFQKKNTFFCQPLIPVNPFLYIYSKAIKKKKTTTILKKLFFH